MNAQLLEGRLDETFLHAACHCADRTNWVLLISSFSNPSSESAQASVQAGLRTIVL
jgi:hypothetical protein